MGTNLIYLDHSAATPMLPEVWEAMRPYGLEKAGNPASSHQAGRQARKALEDAREKLAHLLDAQPEEMLFTSGATESNNIAVFGLAGDPPGVVVSSAIEHPSVLEALQALKPRGFELRLLPVRSTGEVEAAAGYCEGASLMSVMLANHETGVVQPVREMAERLGTGVAVHCDAAAAVGKMRVSFRELGVTSLTVSAHKFHGPKGVGALLVRRQAKLRPLFHGGHQQHGKRPGTEAVPLAVGMAKALELAVAGLETDARHVRELRARFLQLLRAGAAPVVVNGSEERALPNIVNVSFPGCRADALLMALDLAGVACSTGSACSSGSLLPSPVLRAMGTAAENLGSAMRFSFSRLVKIEDVEEAARRIIFNVNTLRHTSC